MHSFAEDKPQTPHEASLKRDQLYIFLAFITMQTDLPPVFNKKTEKFQQFQA